jgi:hypothetical protein
MKIEGYQKEKVQGWIYGDTSKSKHVLAAVDCSGHE